MSEEMKQSFPNPSQDEGMMPTPQKFQKLPVVIEALQFTPEVCWVNWIDRKPVWEGTTLSVNGSYHVGDRTIREAHISIETLEGTVTAQLGDWIIKGVKGEFYPCKPDIFAATYKSVECVSQPISQEVERAREWMETQRNTGIFSSQHEDVYDLLAAYHAHASAEERRRRQAGKTHWPGCWKDHLDCAVEKIEELSTNLQPFAALGGDDDMEAFHDLDDDVVVYQCGRAITASDVRKARKVLGPVSMMHYRKASTEEVAEYAPIKLRSVLDALKEGK